MCQRNQKSRLFSALFIIAFVLLSQQAGAKVAPSEPSLTEEVESILSRYHVPVEDVSIHALSLLTGKPLLAINANRPLIPASTMKILTTVAAFETFGAKHRYPTEIYSSGNHPPRLPDLWIKGYGNPFFVHEELQLIAQTLRKRGIREINGPLYVDDSYFGPAEPIRYKGTTGKPVYRVVTGALSYNFNRPDVLIYKAKRLKRNGSSLTEGIGDETRSHLLNSKLLDPAIYTGEALKQALEKEGIAVHGTVAYGTVDPKATLILHHGSQPMSEVLRGLNKESNNFIAEQILRSMAAARYGIASREMGLNVLAETLRSVGAATIPYQLDNASGLSRKNRLAALQLTAILQHALHEPYGEDFIRTLSIAGVDGTLRRRFKKSALQGKIWAKTGSLYQVSALAGYALVAEEPIAFAILVNEYTVAPDNVKRAQEKIVEAIAKRMRATR